LGELLIEAIEPDIKQAIERRIANRPWEIGSEESPVVMAGHPEYSRGAWVSGLLIRRHLLEEGLQKVTSTDFALSFAATLVGRDDVEQSELSRIQTDKKEPAQKRLLADLSHQYKFWYRAISSRLERHGPAAFTGEVLTMMGPWVWRPFAATQADQPEREALSVASSSKGPKTRA